MPTQTNIQQCTICKSELKGQFCSNCGQPRVLKRINGQYIISEIRNVLNFHKGIFYTIKELIIRPGEVVRKFILEDRNRLVRPLIYLIITSLIYTLAQHWLLFEDGYLSFGDMEPSATLTIFIWIQQNYGYANILMAIFIAMWIKVFFRKYDFNFFEILILLCFVMGTGMLIFTMFGIIDSLTGVKVLQIGGMIGIFYAAWAIGNFFEKGKVMNYLKGFLTYFLGMITFYSIAILLGKTIDFLIS